MGLAASGKPFHLHVFSFYKVSEGLYLPSKNLYCHNYALQQSQTESDRTGQADSQTDGYGGSILP